MDIQRTCRGILPNRIRPRAAFAVEKRSSRLKLRHKHISARFARRKSRRCKDYLPACFERSYRRNQGTQQYSITALTDSSGTIEERYAYSAYGTPTITDGSGTVRSSTAEGNRYTYTGREWDEDVEIYHFRARMYDPLTGRFLSRDPIGFEGSPHNLYSFLERGVLAAMDPTGLIFTRIPCTGAMLRGAAAACTGEGGVDPIKTPICYQDVITGHRMIKHWCVNHGDCYYKQYVRLRSEKSSYCDAPRSCDKIQCCEHDRLNLVSEKCDAINRRIKNGGNCIGARREIMKKCFKGGDATHHRVLKETKEVLAVCERKYSNCHCKNKVSSVSTVGGRGI